MLEKITYNLQILMSFLRGFIIFRRLVYLEGGVKIFNWSAVKIGKNVKIYKFSKIDARTGFINIGNDVIISEYSNLTARSTALEIRDNVFIGQSTHIYAFEKIVEIGEDTLIAPFCYINSGNHGVSKATLIRNQKGSGLPITIGHDCWIGAKTTILTGSQIPDGCIIGANSLVKKNNILSDYKMYAGNPIRFLKDRE